MKKNQPRARKPRSAKSTKPRKENNAQSASEGAAAMTGSDTVIEGRAEETGRAEKKRVGMFQFFQQVRNEGEKVTWTTLNETFISTVMVLIMVIVMVIFFFFVDQALRFGICSILPINCVPLN